MSEKNEQVRPAPIVAVGVLIANDNGEIFLAKSDKWGGRWIVPGGHLDYRELLEDCVRREVREELSVEIDNIKFVQVQDAVDASEQGYMNTYSKHFVFINYSAKLASPVGSIILDGIELQEYRFIKPQEALEKLNLNDSTRRLIECFLDNEQ